MLNNNEICTFKGCSCGARSLSLFLHLSISVNRPVFPVAWAKAYTTSYKHKKLFKLCNLSFATPKNKFEVSNWVQITINDFFTWQVVFSVTPQTILWIPSTQTFSSIVWYTFKEVESLFKYHCHIFIERTLAVADECSIWWRINEKLF